jgi:DNA-binding MarR family transcriptional regulator
VSTTARHGELGDRLRDLMKVVRLLRQRRTADRPAVPLGMVGTLSLIDKIDAGSGCHAKELADRSGLDPSTVSRAVAALVAHGLVERRADATDRRAAVLALTAGGRTALADAHGWYGDLLDRALAGWRPEEIEALGAGLGRFITDIQKTLDQAPDPIHSHYLLEDAR